MSRKIDIHKNLTIKMGTSREDLSIFMMLLRSLLLRMRNIVNDICRDNQITRLRAITFFYEHRAFHEMT
jgi:hypothetical protein